MICDICLQDEKTELIGFYLDEDNILHTNQNSNLCITCLKSLRAEIIGVRKLRRIETASYAHYKVKRNSDDKKKKSKDKESPKATED